MPTPNRLAEIRSAAGISQMDLASELGIDKSTLYRWERGELGIKDERKLQLAARFNVTPGYLMGWEPVGTAAA